MVTLHSGVVFHPVEGAAQNAGRADVFGRDESVVHPGALTANGNNAGPAQIGEVARDFGLGLAEDLDKIADAKLVLSHEIEQAQAREVAECLEKSLNIEDHRLTASINIRLSRCLIYASTTYMWLCIYMVEA